jgi:uncharacterized oligopeptide transporter (OPT) family protein
MVADAGLERGALDHGVLVAFPMKRRFINDEQQPFPEGRACGVVLDTLYTSDAATGVFKAKALAVAALLAGALKFASGESYQRFLQIKVLGRDKAVWIAEHLDKWYYDLVATGRAPLPTLSGIDIRKLGLSPTMDLAMFGAGGLMNIRYAVNMVLGMLLGWAVLAPYAVSSGWVQRKGEVLTAASKFSRTDVLNGWILWPGVAMLVCASMAASSPSPRSSSRPSPASSARSPRATTCSRTSSCRSGSRSRACRSSGPSACG